MPKIFTFTWAKLQIIAGLLLIALGIIVSTNSFVQASDDGVLQWSSIKSGVSDYDMFGKLLFSSRSNPTLSVSDLKVGAGPVVPVRLRIPALNLDTNVEQVGVRNGLMDVPSNVWNAGWLNSSPRPGDIGNAVLAGHKDSTQRGAIFYDLYKLNVGDKIYVSDEGGYELIFEVTDKQTYLTQDAPLNRIFGPTADRQLNLITCEGNFLPNQLTYDKRLIVYTRLITS